MEQGELHGGEREISREGERERERGGRFGKVLQF